MRFEFFPRDHVAATLTNIECEVFTTFLGFPALFEPTADIVWDGLRC